MKIPLIIFLILISTYSAFSQTNFNSHVFTITSSADTTDANLGDGICADALDNCTLRAAIEEANQTVVADTIDFSFTKPTTINLSLGSLSIINDLNMIGPGARRLTVQRSPSPETPKFRIFLCAGTNKVTAIVISGMEIANGNGTNDLFGGAVNIRRNNYLDLREVTVKNNTAFVGGGIFNSGNLSLIRSTVSNNSVTPVGDGGGIYAEGGTRTTIINSTITNNTGNDGGGIHNYGILTIDNSTISHNSASGRGGGVWAEIGSVYTRNTIIANNTASITAPNVYGNFITQGNNLIGDANGGGGFTNGISSDIVGSSANPIDPLLGSLRDNGGQTDTRALSANSLALNAGNNCVLTGCYSYTRFIILSHDQRAFFNRSIGGTVDIGAYEFGSNTITNYWSFTSRLLEAEGTRSIPGATVTFTTPLGEVKYASTNSFGYYRVRDLVVGETYIVQIKSKRNGNGQFVLYPDN